MTTEDRRPIQEAHARQAEAKARQALAGGQTHMTKPHARCKFRVSSVEASEYDETIKLSTQYDPNDSEDTKFSTATPSGSMEFQLSNPKLLGTFKPGQEFYVDLVPVNGAG